ncbi:MAG: LCP family protein [Candidatus Moranbacteria bacterium]|nr:LCP family protein [Candidatus Moranbacteria bacterium]
MDIRRTKNIDGISHRSPLDIAGRENSYSPPAVEKKPELPISENIYSSFEFSQKENHKPKFHWLRNILLGILFLGIAAVITYGTFFTYKFHSTSQKIYVKTDAENPSLLKTLKSMAPGNDLKLKGASSGRINILLLGIAGPGKPGQNLTDTIMVASLDTRTNRVALISIPRDLYVPVPDLNFSTKINSVYQLGLNQNGNKAAASLNLLTGTIKDITALEINYYIVLNFDGFEKIINSLGGINVTSEKDILDTRYPGPNYSYETFEISKGFHHLDGQTALKYARVRHGDPEGDFGRAKRQQQVMQAAKNKIFSSGTLLNIFAFNNLLDALGNNIITNISPDEIVGFIELIKKLDTNNINNVVVDAWSKDSLLKVSHVFFGENSGVRAFILVPRVGNWSEIRELAQNAFDLNVLKRRRDEIAKEDAFITILNRSGDNQLVNRIKKLLSVNLDYKNVLTVSENNEAVSEKTIAYDLNGGKKPFTLDELATKIPAIVSYDVDPAIRELTANKNPDIVLVLGKDIVDRYNMEEDTIEDLNKDRDNQDSINFIKN